MYQPGFKIKLIAIIVGIIGCLAALIIGFMSLGTQITFLSVCTAFIPFISILFGCYVLYLFGDALDNIALLKYQNEEILKYIKEKKEKNTIGDLEITSVKSKVRKWECPNCGNTISQEPCRYCLTKRTNSESGSKPVATSLNYRGNIECPKCGFEQDSNRDKCWKCGATFNKESTENKD